MCPLGGGPYEYQAALLPLLGNSSAPEGGPLRAALGAQYALVWMDTPRQGWTVAIAPGLLDEAAARTAILAQFPAEHRAYLGERLTVVTTPYSEAQLRAAQNQISATLLGPFVTGVGIGCNFSDAVRLQVSIGPDETLEIAAQAQALLAPFGDMVRIVYGIGPAVAMVGTVESLPSASNPSPKDTARSPRVRSYVTLPVASRCVRGTSIGFRTRGDAKSVTLSAGKRRATATSGKRARLALRSRATKVKVTVKLRDGRTATETVTYRRCG